MPTEKELTERIQQAMPQLRQMIADTQHYKDSAVALLKQESDARIAQKRAEYETARRKLVAEIQRLTNEELKLAGQGWDNPAWSRYVAQESGVPGQIRVGEYVARGEYGEVRAPSLAPLDTKGNIVIAASGDGKPAANALLQSIILRLLATFPAGKARFTLFDPVGLGKNVAPFMQLPNPIITDEKAWTEQSHIEDQLKRLTEHMENIIQKYLQHRYKTMEEYNARAGEVAEPYRFLIVTNFPVNFTPESAKRLLSIAQNGATTGVHVLLTLDQDQPLPHGFVLEDLLRSASVIEWTSGQLTRKAEANAFSFIPDTLPSHTLLDKIAAAVVEKTRSLEQVKVRYTAMARPDLWSRRSGDGLSVPIGRRGARDQQEFALGQGTNHHALIAGRTGSGKSTLLHTLICSLAESYSPEELELYLVDSKFGVEFKDYATHRLPHARVVSINSDREFALSVLQGLVAEMERRGDLFRAAGAQSIGQYRVNTGRALPRSVFVMDEFHELFGDNDKIASTAGAHLSRLVMLGRGFGIHVVMATQTLARGFEFSKSLFDQMNVRLALQCSEADSRLILGEDNPTARLLERRGEAVYNDKGGLIEGNNIFQVALIETADRAAVLERLEARARALPHPPRGPIVFEGQEPGVLARNERLRATLSGPAPAQPMARVWLGEPITLKEHTSGLLRRQSHGNLLMVGNNEERAFGMLAAALIGLRAEYRPDSGARFLLGNYGKADETYTAELGAHAAALGVDQILPRNLKDALAGLISELDRRIGASDTATGAANPPVFLMIAGGQRARDLRENRDDYAEDTPNRMFARLCREGPEVGLHVLLACDTLASVTRMLGSRGMDEFGLRVGFPPISANDSDDLLGTPQASQIEPQRALLSDEEKTGVEEQFRPYRMPQQDELK